MKEHEEKHVPEDLPENPDCTFDPTRTRILSDDVEDSGDVTLGSSTGRPRPQEKSTPAPDATPARSDSQYKLHRVIGRGGYGEVWEATQLSLRRTVALKRLREDVILDLRDSGRRVEDFHCEALTTAALEHPNIVPVYDAVADDAGRPQLALKLVHGTTWKAMIEADQELPPAELLARHLPILIDVAQAVAFAHSRGVMHRDIKPSQVLVGEFGEVLLFDWGLALRFTDPPGAEETLNDPCSHPVHPSDPPTINRLDTATCPAGTPAYMAPEQTDESPDRLGPWTDVYLLGGTLYHLLTATSPRGDVQAAAAFLQASLGELERPRERAPDREIPEDLEALAMRALSAIPDERPTALELIAALKDYLSGASQRRESTRLADMVKGALPQAGGSYAALSQCLSDLARASGLWGANPDIGDLRELTLAEYANAALANGDLELARRQTAQLEGEATRMRLEGEISRRARAHRRTARQRRFFLRVSVVLGAALVISAVKYTVDQRRAHKRLEEQRNNAVIARGQAEGLTAFMLEDLTPGLEALGRLDLLDQVARESIAYYASLAADESSPTVMARRSLALRNAGRVLRDQGQLKEARTALDSSLAVASDLVRQLPGDPAHRVQLADRYLELGALMQRTSDPDAAIEAYGHAVSLYESLLEEVPGSATVRRGLARGLCGIAFELWARAELDQSLDALERAVKILEQLVGEQPQDLHSTRLLLEAYARVGHVERDRGALDQAATVTRRAIELGKSLVAADPSNILYLAALSECTSSLGFALWQMGDIKGALEAYQDTLRINRQLAERDPANQARQRDLANAYSNVGEMCRRLGDLDRALDSLRAAVAIVGPLVAANPNQAEWRYVLATALIELGTTHASQGYGAAAQETWRRAAEEMEVVAHERRDLYYLDTYTRALLLLKRVDEARPIAEELLTKGWKNPAFIELCQRNGLLTSSQ